MQFPKQEPRAFTKARVEKMKKGQIGCYGLSRQNVWVYVGKGDIRDRLLAHLNGDNPCITTGKPTHWVDVVIGEQDSHTWEKELIRELDPICNKRVG